MVEPDQLAPMFTALREQARTVDPERVIDECAVAPASRSSRATTPSTRRCSPAIRSRRRCCSSAATSTCSARRRCRIVGTRNATAAGRATAFELGEALADAGLAVVSGLARGVDAAAHRGVRARRWSRRGVSSATDSTSRTRSRTPTSGTGSATTGCCCRSGRPARRPRTSHFPLRNRIIAALGDVLVVVESRETRRQPDHGRGRLPIAASP